MDFLKRYTKDKKNTFIAVFIILLVGVSWVGSLDDYSTAQTNQSIVEAGTAYAIARGVNAIVSVLQSATIESGVVLSGSITIGELLDPVNDLIERFSSVMSFALASLVLQKILLVISSNGLFKVLITVLGIGSLFCLSLAKNSLRLIVFRCFIITVFLRFSLVMVVLLNAQVDKLFLSETIEDGTELLSGMRTEMTALESSATTADKRLRLKAGIESARHHILTIETKLLPPLELKLMKADVRVFEAEKVVNKLAKNESWNPLKKSSGMMFAENNLKAENSDRSKIKAAISKYKKDIESFNVSVEDKKVELVGGPKNSKDGLLVAARNTMERMSWSNIELIVSTYVNIITDLIVLFMLKTIIIPVLFLYCLMKGTKLIWVKVT